MKAYIKGAAAISPQKSFDDTGFLDEVIFHNGITRLNCIEPVYRDFIDPMVSRRMSRVVKMGVSCALKCLKNTGIPMPDAIITGTGLGCLEDTGKFLSSIYTSEEKLLNPTPFIQSTHNTVAGAIALAIKCHGYNSTYTHRGFSFESALADALLLLSENSEMNILAGGFDEFTADSLTITHRLGLWKNHPVDTENLFKSDSRGSIPGEGVAFFMLGGKKSSDDMASIVSMETTIMAEFPETESGPVDQMIHKANIDPGNVDLVILGLNGDQRTDIFYQRAMNGVFKGHACMAYKHLCGEFDTSSSFALWMAASILKHQKIPISLLKGDLNGKNINTILLYNHVRGFNHSLILLERC